MTKPLNSKAIRISFGIAVSVLAWISIASYWSTHVLIRSFSEVAQGHEALGKFEHIEVLMESAESGVDSYVITGEADRLNSFQYAKLVVPYELRQINQLMPVHSSKRDAFNALRELLAAHLSYLSHVVVIRKSQGAEAAGRLVAGETGSKRDAMERLLSEIQQEEMSQLSLRWDHASEHSLKTKAFLALVTLISLALVGWIYGLLRREYNDRLQAESAKGQTETFLQSIIDRIPYMILVKEADNLRITLANKAAEEWLGRPVDKIIKSNALDLRSKEEAQVSMQTDRQALGENRLIDTEERLALEGKEPRVLHTQKIPVPNAEGHPAFLLTISEDITRRKQAERMLEISRDAAVESARLRSEFIRNMSHEFRTPLSIVMGMISLMQDTTLSKEQRRYADTVRRASEGLSVLVKSILDFSKIEAGSFSLENREVNVRQVADEVVAMMNEQANAKGISLVTLVGSDIPNVVRGDPARLRQVLTQLVANAVKFTEKGEISLRVSVEKQNDSQMWLTWRITDTGIGIAEDVQKHLFEPFRQGDGSYTRRYGGTGLGLAMCKRIVELMGGHIDFKSAPRIGSTFWFTAPANKRHVHGPTVRVKSLPWTRERVLIVSENDASRQLIEQQLKDCALSGEAVASGQTAIEVLRREEKAGRAFPIVLLDLQLPDMDGVDFARRVKQDAALAGTKLILMSDDPTALEAGTFTTLGFTGSIRVPPEPRELYERLASWFDPHEPTSHQHAA